MTDAERRRSSRIPALTSAVVAGVLAGVLAVPAGATADPLPAIDWRPCVPVDAREQGGDPDPGPDPAEARHDVQCADVRVPVDHSDPEGRTFTVAVTRIPATGERTGVLFGNPGGPGIDARGMWIDAVDRVFDTAVDELNRTHDLVTVQPRGLAGAGEMVCPGMGADMPYTARAWACHEADPEFVGSLTTANVVRDTDLVRRLMGLGRIGFLGYSYGTAVGMAYLSLFPGSLERVVLDSSVGPSSTWWKQSEATAALHRQPARDAFLAWIARHDAAYGLGTTARQVYWRLREHDQLSGDRARRYLPPPGPAGSLSGSSDLGAQLGVRVDDAIGAAEGRYTRPSEVGESAFAVLDRNAGFPSMWPGEAAQLSWLVGERARVVSGPAVRVPAVYDAVGGGDDDHGDDDHGDDDEVTTADRDTYIGILRCAENLTPPEPGVEPALDLAVRLGSSEDTVDHLRHRALGCPFPAASAPPATRAPAGAVRPLVLQSDGDPFTPPGPARLTAEATGGVLVRVRGIQHALFGYGNPAVDGVVLRHLRTGETAGGLHLPAAPDPVPW